MMKKLMFLGAGAIGYVLGAKAGRERYEQIAAQAQKLRQNPTVQHTVDEAKARTQEAAGTAKDKAQEAAHTARQRAKEKAGGAASTPDGTQPAATSTPTGATGPKAFGVGNEGT